MKKVLLLLLIVASRISGSEHQAIPFLALDQHSNRRLTRFEQGIVSKAAAKIVKCFEEQVAAEFNFLTLPFELQIMILDRLSIAQQARVALVNREFRKLVERYRQQVVELDISDRLLSLTPKCIQEIARQYSVVKRLFAPPILDGNIRKVIRTSFPKLEELVEDNSMVIEYFRNFTDQLLNKWLTKRNYNF